MVRILSSRLSRLVALFAVVGLFPAIAFAQNYPVRAITLIVPFAAGGPTDTIARALAPKLSELLGQQVVIENVTGAGGMLGISRLAKAEPDGYTLLLADLALPAGLVLNKNFNLGTDAFDTIGLVNSNPMVIMSRPKLADDGQALVKLLRSTPSKFLLGHSGVGSNAHLCALLFQQALGVQLTEVPFRGAGPAMTDLLAGHIDVMCVQSTAAMAYVGGDRLTSYGVTSRDRLAIAPQLPTLAEAGLQGLELSIWHGLYAPKNTPRNVVETLNKALQGALRDESIQKYFQTLGLVDFPLERRSPEAHRSYFQAEFDKLNDVISRATVPGVK